MPDVTSIISAWVAIAATAWAIGMLLKAMYESDDIERQWIERETSDVPPSAATRPGEMDELRRVVRALLDHVNDKYPDKDPRAWTCPHMARLDELVPPGEAE